MTKTLSFVTLSVMCMALGAQTQTSPPAPDPTMSPGTTQTSRQPQSATDAPTPQATAKADQVEASSVTAELTKSLDSKHARVGDEVNTKITNEAKLPDGTTLPRGTKLVGNVVDVTAKSKQEKNARIVISLNRAVLKDGKQVPIRSSVTSVTAPVQNDPSMAMSSGGAPSGGATSAGGNTGGATASSTPSISTPVTSETQSTPGAMLKGAADRVAVGNKPNVMLSAPNTPDSAGILEAQGDNIALESGTKLTVNIIPVQGGA